MCTLDDAARFLASPLRETCADRSRPRKAARGADHKDVAVACSSLARLHAALGRLDVAAPLLERSLAIRENWYAPGDPRVATACANLAALRNDLGQLDAAGALFERALAIHEATRGADHRETINARGNFARVAMLRGDAGSAERGEGRAAVEQALRRLEAPPHSLPGTHPWVRKFEGFLA